MSDYLWDKTGEPDAETERLENLLGQLRFQPTPFDLPAELPAKHSRATQPRRGVVTWPRLALAASLTLAVLAGAWLMLRQQAGSTHDAPQLAAHNKANSGEKSRAAVPTPTAAAPNAADGATASGVHDEKKGTDKPAAAPSPNDKTPRKERGGARPRPRLPDLAGNAQRRQSRQTVTQVGRVETAGATNRQLTPAPRTVEPARREETVGLTAEERDATEKVLYALRVTSEKLGYARRQVRESGRAEAIR